MWRYQLYMEMSFPDFINDYLPSLSVQNYLLLVQVVSVVKTDFLFG